MPVSTTRQRCSLCGRRLTGLICLSCDTHPHRPVSRPRRVWGGAVSAARGHRDRAGVTLALVVLVAAVGFVITDAGGGAWVPPPGAPAAVEDGVEQAPDCASVLAVNASVSELDASPGRPGFAFAVRRTSRWTDLLSDYYLVADRHLTGQRTVSVFDGDRHLTAQIMAVAREANAVRLRVPASVPALTVARRVPQPGDRVTVQGAGTDPVSGIVLTYRGAGGATHLAFSGVVPPELDGAPVLDAAGEVVGIAEPSDERLCADGVGLAVPIATACADVGC